MIRVVCHVTGGSDPRTTDVSIELGGRDAPDAVPHLMAALRAEVARRRMGESAAVEAAAVEAPPVAVLPAAEDVPKPDA